MVKTNKLTPLTKRIIVICVTVTIIALIISATITDNFDLLLAFLGNLIPLN